MAEDNLTELNPSALHKALDWAYNLAVDGLPAFDSAQELAEKYLQEQGELVDKVNLLIAWQDFKAASSGFINGLGGAPLMPLTIPFSLTSVLYLQVRMVAAIAIMGGHDIRDERVKTMISLVLCGNTAKDLFKEAGIKLGTRLTEQALQTLSKEVVARINQRIGSKLVQQLTESGMTRLGKAIPLVGGLIGATFDTYATNEVGNLARDTFIVQNTA